MMRARPPDMVGYGHAHELLRGELGNLAVIPVRAGSKRLPGKNTLDFFGKPMFMHSVDAAVESGLFAEVHVSTESPEIADICRDHGVEVAFLRAARLASDEAGLDEVCRFVLDTYRDRQKLEFEFFCLLWATAPLRSHTDIVRAYGLLNDDTDAVVSVTSYDLPVFCAQRVDDEGWLSPCFPDMLWLSSQEMPKVFCDNGSHAWVRVSAFRQEGVWMPRRSRPYLMDKIRSVDIDTYEDLMLARYYYQRQLEGDTRES